MENTKEILRTIVEDAVNDVLTVISNDLKQMNYSDIVRTTQQSVNKLGARLIEQIVHLVDESFNAQRDKHAIILRHTKTRKMVSQMGDINLTRRLYFDKNAGRYFFAVDEILNIEKYSRIDGELKSKLINDATLTSYGKASALSDSLVSRQTVHNLVKRVPAQSLTVQAQGFKKVDKIFIEADEDHIHLNTGKSAEVKLVYVHEGRRSVNRGRSELVNAKYFVSVSGGTEIWDTVADYLYDQYAVRDAEVHLAGDGASWIKYGLELIPNAKYHIDKFHVYKSVTDATTGDKSLRRQIIKGLKAGDKAKVRSLYLQRWNGENTVRQRNRIFDSLTYVENNFEAINLVSAYGCSAEGHVSHVLSARLSSRPMAWSRKGAEKMAKLRAYYFNGGNFAKLLQAEDETTEEDLKRYNIVIKHNDEPYHTVNQAHIVGIDGITDEVSRILRWISKN